jgi:hypothetical protein
MHLRDVQLLVKADLLLSGNIPEWANWIAIDGDGLVFVFDVKPIYVNSHEHNTKFPSFYFTLDGVDRENPQLERVGNVGNMIQACEDYSVQRTNEYADLLCFSVWN